MFFSRQMNDVNTYESVQKRVTENNRNTQKEQFRTFLFYTTKTHLLEIIKIIKQNPKKKKKKMKISTKKTKSNTHTYKYKKTNTNSQQQKKM